MRFIVGDYLMSEILVDPGQDSQDTRSRFFKLNLQTPIRYNKGAQFLSSFLGCQGDFPPIILDPAERESRAMYGLPYGEYLLLMGLPGAVTSFHETLAKSFEIKMAENEFTYADMHVVISEYKDGNSVSIDCDELTKRFLARHGETIEAQVGPADPPLSVEGVEKALKIEEEVLAKLPLSWRMDCLRQPVSKEDSVQFTQFLKDLRELEDCGRRDLYKIRAHFENHNPVLKVGREIHIRMMQQVCYYLRLPYRVMYTYEGRIQRMPAL